MTFCGCPELVKKKKKLPAFYGIRMCNTLITITPKSYPFLSQINPVHTLPTISLRPTLILYFHLRLDLLSRLRRSGFPTDALYAFLFSATRSTHTHTHTHTPPIPSSKIPSSEPYQFELTNQATPRYALFSSLLSLADSWAQVS